MGSATTRDCDQTLADVHVGPIEVGINRFVLKAGSPDIEKIPPEDLPLTGVMLKAYYNDQEFIRIGYYVQNTVPEDKPENPPPNEIERNILLEDVSITPSQIKWN